MTRNILNFSSYNVTDVHEDEHDYQISADSIHAPVACSYCQSHNLIGFGRREQLINDLPIHGKRVGIYVNARRMKCRSCNKTFTEELPDIDTSHKMTQRLVKWIGEQSINRTFISVAEEVGIAESTVRTIFRNYINQLEEQIRFETPKWMGIDEIHIIKKPRCVISNIEHNTAVEVLWDRTKKTVMNYLQRLENRDKVRYVAMDMWKPYRDAIQAVLPDATIVIDKFHVVRMANDALEKIRKEHRSQLNQKQRRGLMRERYVLLKRRHALNQEDAFKLDGWSSNYPILGAAYDAKEAFFGIWDLDSKDDAQNAYESWKSGLPEEIKPGYSDLIRAVDNWHQHIFTYWDHPVTNAYTESLNSLIRIMSRLGRGYSFEALRAKILFAHGSYKKKVFKPAVRRRPRVPDAGSIFSKTTMNDSMFDFSKLEQQQEKVINYGADIDALVEMFSKELL